MKIKMGEDIKWIKGKKYSRENPDDLFKEFIKELRDMDIDGLEKKSKRYKNMNIHEKKGLSDLLNRMKKMKENDIEKIENIPDDQLKAFNELFNELFNKKITQ